MSWKPQKDCPCASGTWHTTGEAIHAAVREQHRAALLSAPGEIRRKRKPQTWRKMYEAAMSEKRGMAKLI